MMTSVTQNMCIKNEGLNVGEKKEMEKSEKNIKSFPSQLIITKTFVSLEVDV